MTPLEHGSFSSCHTATWPVVLTAAQIAAIFQRAVGGIRKSVQQRTFQPAPILTDAGTVAHPLRWRRCDVLRHVEGARGFGGLRRSA